ncbi:hypothetical protein MPTK1_3g12820 [Marchantia polymorpha subsp. ruderalis]|uniref:Protein kinase domain-containing protein n=2 Tax=Marchantia polymorpha TaxID=3197 RepID=A0AAF6B071_MARPO|nr:hypothetical protein MARPO_0050s0074 [Marchantia polymorpha]BBN05405.1 hypothetical protein Mp_3g12820 [Marchantia polymorpha subsp. ruderalis]|eukprot:PTQ38618.1 hypothetical protein MARPO_0050s0074 [Marchantia polymorpha]
MDDDDSYDVDPPPYVPVKHIIFDSTFWDRWKLVGSIESGPFTACMAVEDKADPGKKYALQIDSKMDRFGINADSRQCLGLFRKCVVLNRILPKHKHINALDRLVFSQTSMFILQDMCEGMLDLNHFYPMATDILARALFTKIAETVLFMHEYGVVHGNLTSSTILYFHKPFTDSIACKITGFDLAIHYPHLATKHKRNFHQSDYLYDHHLSAQTQVPYTVAGDVRAMGKILYNMLVNNPDPDDIPATGPDFKPWVRDAALNLLRMIGPRGFGPASDDALPGAQVVVNHPWLKLPPPGPQMATVKELDRFRNDWSVRVLESLICDRSDCFSH